MSHNDCIRTSLDLKDPNITFPEIFCQEKQFKGHRTKFFYGKLSYTPTHCTCCGMKNENFSIVKNGFLTSSIKWLPIANYPTYLLLKKQRFLCKNCGVTFVATSPEIEEHCFISKRVKQSIAVELEDNLSRKDLAKRHFVSQTTVERVLVKRGREKCPNPFDSLPENICMDEFKSVANVQGKMSFIYSDAVTHRILDILPNRRLTTVKEHFYRYSYKARCRVKTVVVDMNAAYFTLVKELFPNAKVIIDRFHLVQLTSRSFNQTRIKVMNTFRTSSAEDQKNYRKLKKYWSLLLKESSQLDYQNYRYHRLFKKSLPETEIVDFLLTLSPVLKESYFLYQELLTCTKQNDFEGFQALILQKHENLLDVMKVSLKTLKKHLKHIQHTFLNPTLSNGSLEGAIHKIKVIKRTAYGYRNFWNFKYRILISFQNKEKSSGRISSPAA